MNDIGLTLLAWVLAFFLGMVLGASLISDKQKDDCQKTGIIRFQDDVFNCAPR